jgi:methanogenic corrinoid protein MtbC1
MKSRGWTPRVSHLERFYRSLVRKKIGSSSGATQDIFNAVLAFDEAAVKAKTQAEIDGGTSIDAILNQGLISAMDEVGEPFSAGDLFVPEMLMAAQAMKAGLAILKPQLAVGKSSSKGTVVIGTIKAVKEAGMTVKTIVGGAPVTQSFADKIGAQGYSADAPGAVKLAKQPVAKTNTVQKAFF